VPARARAASVLATVVLAVGTLLGFVPGHTGRPDAARAATVVSDHGAVLAAHGQRLAARAHAGGAERIDGLGWVTPPALPLVALLLLVVVPRSRSAAASLRIAPGADRPRAPPVAV
jgi:hypothetical protein